jgi:ADP-heptose:LPS heptosyltransferase
MTFNFIRLLDHVVGRLLQLVLVPLCSLAAKFFPPHAAQEPSTICILKLHGGGSLLIALPALLGLRQRYPGAKITLIGTHETKKYAELTGVFNDYVLIQSSSLPSLVMSGFGALRYAFQKDIFIDFEPHSSLAAVFTPLTMARQRIGLVKWNEAARTRGYTDAIYFNVNAPIYSFYDQAVGRTGVEPASIDQCGAVLRVQADNYNPLPLATSPKPVIYISAFTSSLSPERMMPYDVWAQQLKKKFAGAPITVILGGGPQEAERIGEFGSFLKTKLPTIHVIEACNGRSLRQAIADINSADIFWGIDSGPLHIARWLKKPCTSFWGPSDPAFRLRAIEGLAETVFYRAFPCSPCVHMADMPPCKGDNQCMKKLFSDDPPPTWRMP